MKIHAALLACLTLLLSCESDDDPKVSPVENTKLKSVTTYFDTQNGYRPGDSTTYAYNSSGNLTHRYYYTYDIVEEKFDLISIESFTYTNNRVTEIEKEIIPGTGQISTTVYEYAGGRISRILLDDEIDTEAFISYPHKDTIAVAYDHSNGSSFTYRFTTVGNNVGYEETFDSNFNLASETTNEFDNGINPYSLLGYTDLFFTNFSRNNKTKTESEYYAIGFPNSVPFAYEYEYNENNLPVQQIIIYKAYPNGHLSGRTKTFFEYE